MPKAHQSPSRPTLAIRAKFGRCPDRIRAQFENSVASGASKMTRPSEQAFDELERVGGVSLTPDLRQKIERALQRYEQQRRAQPKSHELAAALAISLEQSIGLINRMQHGRPGTWKHITGVTPLSEADLTSLKAFQANCKKYGGAHRGRPRDSFMPRLLTELAKTFAAAGGEARIQHGTRKKRQGPFLDFLFSAQGHLPSDLRHSEGAIGAAWQRICAAREKGNFVEMDISQPKVFDLVMSRRRIKPPKRRGR